MSLSLIKINAGDLEVGMYVSELDRPWVDTPFPLQGFHIRDYSEIRKVQNYCKFVFIDVEKGSAPDENTVRATPRPGPQQKKKVAPQTASSQIQRRPVKLKSVKYTNHQPLESELSKGEKIYTEIEGAFEESLKSLKNEQKFDATASKRAVKQITESVIRNPDALVWLSKMKASHDATYSHAIRAAVLAASFGVHLGMKQEDIEILTLGVLLCDIGITRLPEDALLLAKKLELEDIPEYSTHIALSLEILKESDNVPEDIIPIVESHHERLDGSGYPFGLSGNQIPILAQIAGLVDEFDRITSVRAQDSQMTPAEGASRIYKMRNGAFNEQLVEEFIKAVGIYPAGTLVELNSDEIGIVIAQNPERKLLPKVMILRDKDGKVVHKKTIVDLYQRSQVQSGSAQSSIRKSLIDAGIELDIDILTQGFSMPKESPEKSSWSLKSLFSAK